MEFGLVGAACGSQKLAMKQFLVIAVIAAAAWLCAGCSRPKENITKATSAIPFYLQKCVVQRELTKPEVLLMEHKKIPVRPVVDQKASLHILGELMDSTDVTGCPEDFRYAWMDAAHLLENFTPAENTGHPPNGAAMTGAGGTHASVLAALAAKQFEENSGRRDVLLAFENIETVALKYGVRVNAKTR